MILLPLLILLPLIPLLHHLYTCLTSPLNAIHGPWHAKVTRFVLKWHEFHFNRTRYLHSLHKRYGPVVRIAPDEVAFATPEAVKTIYCEGGSGYDKTRFYDLFKVYGRRTMFTTLEKDEHARRRRLIADRYANTNVLRPQSLGGIAQNATNFVRRCFESVGGSLDIYICLHAYAFDCITHHLFDPYDTKSLQDVKDEEVMREVTFDDSLQNRLLKHYHPTIHRLLGNALRTLFNAKPRETPLADAFVLDKTTSPSLSPSPSPFTLLHRLRQSLDKSEKADYDDSGSAQGTFIPDSLDIAAECLDHMAAGIDTTGDALCFLMWELSQPRSRHVQRKLQQELLAAKSNGVTDNKLAQLPYLEAVIMEGLRCWPAIPMSLPRVVPWDEKGGKEIDGWWVPSGTVVSCQAYSVHRLGIDSKGEWFPEEAEGFRPERWLGGEAEEWKKRFFAFATGGRGCIGKHLALAEMRLLLKEVYSRFSTFPDDSMTQEDMDMSDQLISSRPRGQRCLLRFVPLEDLAGKHHGSPTPGRQQMAAEEPESTVWRVNSTCKGIANSYVETLDNESLGAA